MTNLCPYDGRRADDTGSVIKTWIVVREPGCVPEKKHPVQTHAGIIAFALDIYACRPEGTQVTVCELTWDHDLWVSDGRELLWGIEGNRGARAFKREIRALRSEPDRPRKRAKSRATAAAAPAAAAAKRRKP